MLLLFGSTTTVTTPVAVRPELLIDHFLRPSVLLKSPAPEPAYRIFPVVGSLTRSPTLRFVKPTLLATQPAPPVELLNTPPPPLPEYKTLLFVRSTARDRTVLTVNPTPAGVQFKPPSILL